MGEFGICGAEARGVQSEIAQSSHIQLQPMYCPLVIINAFISPVHFDFLTTATTIKE